jgi:hypothetical protein
MAVGVARADGVDQSLRFRKLLQLLQSDRPSSTSDHQTWIQAATRWAEIVALRWSLPGDVSTDDKSLFDAAHQSLEHCFHEWMVEHYGTLHSLSYFRRPVMLHQVPRHMSHRLAGKGNPRKLAVVVVVDGLAMDQWAAVRQPAHTANPGGPGTRQGRRRHARQAVYTR